MSRLLSGFRVRQVLVTGGMVQACRGVLWVHRRTDARSRKIGRIAPPTLARLLREDVARRDLREFGRYVGAMPTARPHIRPIPVPHDLMPNAHAGLRTSLLREAKRDPDLHHLPFAESHFRNDHDLAARPLSGRACQATLAAARLSKLGNGLGDSDMALLEHVLLSNPSAASLAACTGQTEAAVLEDARRVTRRFLSLVHAEIWRST